MNSSIWSSLFSSVTLKKALLLVCLFSMLGCVGTPSPVVENNDALDTLTTLMTGSFSSAKQAANDDQFYDIRLEMVRIWTKRTDGVWLYVEQASAAALDKPYRQRVYHLTGDGQAWKSEVFELPGADAYIGGWKRTGQFDGLSPDRLTLRTGWAVYLEQSRKENFRGSTRDKECLSQLRGASYATSEVVITQNGISSWNRGYDSKNTQVWGAVVGPYQFDRL